MLQQSAYDLDNQWLKVPQISVLLVSYTNDRVIQPCETLREQPTLGKDKDDVFGRTDYLSIVAEPNIAKNDPQRDTWRGHNFIIDFCTPEEAMNELSLMSCLTKLVFRCRCGLTVIPDKNNLIDVETFKVEDKLETVLTFALHSKDCRTITKLPSAPKHYSVFFPPCPERENH